MTYKSSTFALLGVLLGIFLTSTMQFVIAWTGPTQPAPNGTVAGPVTLSAVDQVKAGGLGVSNLVAAGTIVANGGLRLVPGAGAGKVITSDASGNASRATPVAAPIASYSDLPQGSIVGYCQVMPNRVVYPPSSYVAQVGCTCPTGFSVLRNGDYSIFDLDRRRSVEYNSYSCIKI